MRFATVSLLVLSSVFATLVQGAAVQNDVVYDLSPEEWKAKWDAWPTRNETEMRKLMFSRREDVLGMHNGSSLATPGEVCERITGCIGAAVASSADWTQAAIVASSSACATAANFAANQFSANNFALARKTASFVVTEIAIPLALSVPQFFINLAMQNDAPQSTDDMCGVAQTQAIAEQAGTVTFTWCLQLQQLTSSEAFSRADFGTVSNLNSDDDVGLDLKARLFLSRTQGMFAQACELLGVFLKRSLTF